MKNNSISYFSAEKIVTGVFSSFVCSITWIEKREKSEERKREQKRERERVSWTVTFPVVGSLWKVRSELRMSFEEVCAIPKRDAFSTLFSLSHSPHSFHVRHVRISTRVRYIHSYNLYRLSTRFKSYSCVFSPPSFFLIPPIFFISFSPLFLEATLAQVLCMRIPLYIQNTSCVLSQKS